MNRNSLYNIWIPLSLDLGLNNKNILTEKSHGRNFIKGFMEGISLLTWTDVKQMWNQSRVTLDLNYGHFNNSTIDYWHYIINDKL